MSESFQVRVDGLRFDAAHFATFGGACEPLHGHSYAVAATVEGPLSSESWVIDFVALKSVLGGICQELEHRFLLQRESRLLAIEEDEAVWRVKTPAGVDYVLPKADVVALPIDNTTAERLAQWFGSRLWQALAGLGGTTVSAVTVEVSEGPGQMASHRREGLPLE